MRLCYTLIALLLAPLLFVNWLMRGVRERAYWRHLGERLGEAPRSAGPTLWVHAVSAGEVQASAPLVTLLRDRHPTLALVVTTATPAGRARAAALYPAATVCYAPIDLPWPVARFYARSRPAVAVMMETELWPNLYAAAAARGVPIVIASARLSERSTARYRRIGAFAARVLAGVSVAAQTEADAARFVAIGAEARRVVVTGNLKFDFAPPADLESRARAWRAVLGADRPVWVAGSTHAGEETVLLEAHGQVCARRPGAFLILAPRHPPRFAEVESLLIQAGVRHAVRRGPGALPDTTGCAVLLLATLGELTCAYAAGDVAYVGGTLVPIGGHNLLEPAALGRPVLFGPAYTSARAMAELLIEAGAGTVVRDAPGTAAALDAYFASRAARDAAGEAGRRAVERNRGAAERTAALVGARLRVSGNAG